MSELYLIKPTRSYSGEQTQLTQEYINHYSSSGVEITIHLDLNILSKIRKVIECEENYCETFLPKLVVLLRSITNIFLSPFVAILESKIEFRERNYRAFEKFLSIYLPKFRDSFNPFNIDQYNRYLHDIHKVDEHYNFLLKLNYASILCIHYVNLSMKAINFDLLTSLMPQAAFGTIKLKNSDLQSIFKFNQYLARMNQGADLIGGIESEIAKLAFFDWSQVKKETSEKYLKVVKNFIKPSLTGSKLLANSRNAAADINYYRYLAWESNKFKEIKSDNWFLTADKGLKELSEVLFHIEIDKDYCKLKSCRKEDFYQLPYWNICDNMYNYIISERDKAWSQGKIVNVQLLDNFTKNLEERLLKLKVEE